MWAEGSVATVAGNGNPTFLEAKDGQGNEASFNHPFGVAVDPSGQLLVTDESNHCVRCISLQGKVSVFAGTARVQGYKDGSASQAELNSPMGLAMAEDGTMHVADNANHRIRKITPQGEVSTLAGTGSAVFKDGSIAQACFFHPFGLALDGTGSIIVADYHNHRIRRVTPQGVTTLAGNGQKENKDGSALEASFKFPRAVAVGPSGHVMVTDENGRLCLISKGQVSTVATGFKSPSGLLVDCRGNAIVSDTRSNRIVFCTPQGAVTVIAGNGQQAFKDGSSVETSFNHPHGLALDHQGRVVVADWGNHRMRALTLPSTKRLQMELAHIQSPSAALPAGCSVTRSAKSLFKWSAVLQVTEGPFQGGLFELSLEMPFDYPASGPLVKFVPPLMSHPNADKVSGEVSYGLVKFAPPLAFAHPNVDSVSGEVNYGEWANGGDESKANKNILGVLGTIRNMLPSVEELLIQQVSLVEQRIGSKGLFERQAAYDKRVTEPRKALEAAKAKLEAFQKSKAPPAPVEVARDGSVEFWSQQLAAVLDPGDLAVAAAKFSAAGFRQRHVAKLSQQMLRNAGLSPGVIMDFMDNRHLMTGAAGEDAPATPSVLLEQWAPHLPRIREAELTMGSVLGKGSYSEVRSAVWTRSITVGRQQVSKLAVAVKMSRVVSGDGDEMLISADMARDLAVISNLPHQNILTVHGVCESKKTAAAPTTTVKIVYELMSTDLAKLLERCEQRRLPKKLLLRVLRDVSAGLAHLHHHKVLHGDVKPANVLLRGGGERLLSSLLLETEQQGSEGGGNGSSSSSSSSPASPSSASTNKMDEFEQVKLCDFGSSKDLQQSLQQMSHRVGTLDYMAPEVLHKEPVGQAADVWSFGVVLFECVTGKVCGVKTPMAELKAELLEAGCGAELVQVFEQCHQMEQKERPLMEAIHEQLQLLVMRSIHDEHTLKQELKRAVAQDLETYNTTWSKHCAAQQAMPELLLLVAELTQRKPPRAMRQPLLQNGGKGSLEELEQLASSAGGAAEHLHSLMRALVEECGGTYVRDRKSRDSSNRKVTKDYKGDYSMLLDLERATGLFDEASGMLQFLQRLAQGQQPQQLDEEAKAERGAGEKLPLTVLRCKDKLNRPLDSGYRDVLLNVYEEQSGFVAELQLNFHKIAEIKGHAHRIYELTRVLDLPWIM